MGDSGQHKDPIYGQGIGDAVRTARLLADHVVEALGGDGSFDSLPGSFHAARDADLSLYSSTGHVDGTNGDLLMLGPPFVLTDYDETLLVERTAAAIRSVA